MGCESTPVPICPGVDKVWLAGSSGFVYRMSSEYLRKHSPFAFSALAEAGSGIPGLMYDRKRADMLILGPGRYERELIQPVEAVRQLGFIGRQVHVHGIDLNSIPADVTATLPRFSTDNPQIQLTHRQDTDITAMPALQPIIAFLKSGNNDHQRLARAVYSAMKIHRESYLAFPIDTVSLQGVADYLQPLEMTALLLYIAQVIRPSTFLIRLAYGEIGRTHMQPADRDRFEQSIEQAMALVQKREYEYTEAWLFLQQVITLQMSAEDRKTARLSETYPGSHPPVDTLVNFLQSTDGFYGADTAVELWKLPDSAGNEEIASVLVTLKHW